MKKETICFFNTNKAWGGGEKWHFESAMAFYEAGKEILIITDKRSELFSKIKDTDLKYKCIRVSNFSFLNFFKLKKIKRILFQENVSKIILNLSSDMKAAGLAAKKAGIKKIIYRRGSAIPIRNTFINKFFFKNVVTDIIANSEETKKTILQNNPDLFPVERIKVIYNGIRLDEFDNIPFEKIYQREGNEIILGNAGRLVKQKAQKYLIDVAAILKENGVNFKLLIAGDGKLKNDLIRQAKERGVEKEVKFIGFVNNIKSFMESIDIFLLSSLWEGFGYVLVEAMLCAKPVVAFKVSSNKEIIIDNESGFLVDDLSAEEFAEKTMLLINDKNIREKMGNFARESSISRFDIERSFIELEEFLFSEDK